jgi:enoyl-CoA hydratase
MSDSVHYEVVERVARITFDDGKANALSHDAIDAIHAALDRADVETDAGALVFAGRPGRFSAGFDLSVMKSGIDQARGLARAGAELALRFYLSPRPVVLACTGHALAAGAIVLMAGDVRIGAAGDFKIGLNEVAIGVPVPAFATELARDRLSRRHLTAATVLATIYDPDGARDAGYLDTVVAPEQVVDAATARAQELAATLNLRAFATTRRTLRGGIADAVRAGLDADLERFFVDA